MCKYTTYRPKGNKSIVVTGGGKTMRRRESVLDENTGNVTAIRQYLEDGKVALHELEYDPYGNLVKVTRPANARGERLSIEYESPGKTGQLQSILLNVLPESSPLQGFAVFLPGECGFSRRKRRASIGVGRYG